MTPPQAVRAIADLPTRERYGQVLSISLPIILALTSQNLLNIVDTWIVGRLGSLALAAVALAGTTNWVLSSFFIGLGSGVQAFASRRLGQGDIRGAVGALNRSLLFIGTAVIPFALLASFAADELLQITTQRDDVLLAGTPYLSIRLAGIPFLAANFAFRGYWNGLSLSKLYLRTILLIHVTNVIVSYVLVFGLLGFPEMGVFGAGVGSTVAQAIGTIYYFYLARRQTSGDQFLKPGASSTLRELLRLGAPAGAQTLLFSTGFLIFFIITDKVGPKELGASQVLVTMALVSILPAVGFGLGGASLVGQALGASRPDDARKWGWLTVQLGCGLVGLIGLTEALAAPWLMETFIPTDPEAAALGIPALRIIGGMMVLDAVGVILSNTLIGAGAAKQVMYWSVATQYGVFLPVAWYAGLHLHVGLVGLWGAFAFYRILFGAAAVFMWRGDAWTRIKV